MIVISPSGEMRILSRPVTKQLVSLVIRVRYIAEINRRLPLGPSEVLMISATVRAANICDYKEQLDTKDYKRSVDKYIP